MPAADSAARTNVINKNMQRRWSIEEPFLT
jgi:hypothetical protein